MGLVFWGLGEVYVWFSICVRLFVVFFRVLVLFFFFKDSSSELRLASGVKKKD